MAHGTQIQKSKSLWEKVLNIFPLLVLEATVWIHLICLRTEIVNGSSSDFSVHPGSRIEYLMESNYLRQEKEIE